MRIIIDGKEVELPAGGSSGGGNPIGTVISFLGRTAPSGYLVCDGAEYEIYAYPALAEFFERQFGTPNHFGGNGTDTFAVPDLRNLFLRGYHGEAEEALSDIIGKRQEGTSHSGIFSTTTSAGQLGIISSVGDEKSELNYPQNVDSISKFGSYRGAFLTQSKIAMEEEFLHKMPVNYTSRPVNMAVLYCIKATNEGGPGGSGSVEIESYETSDGWHVRKWSDGYLEQTLKKEINNVIVNTKWGSGYNAGVNYGPFQYPESFSELYGVNISGSCIGSSMIVSNYDTEKASHLIKTPSVGLFRPAPATEEMDFYIFITARGRWK